MGEGEFIRHYGHATPYKLAPKEQTDVPFIIWFSDKYLAEHKDINTQNISSSEPVSHDNVFFTILEIGGIQAKRAQNEKLNLLNK